MTAVMDAELEEALREVDEIAPAAPAVAPPRQSSTLRISGAPSRAVGVAVGPPVLAQWQPMREQPIPAPPPVALPWWSRFGVRLAVDTRLFRFEDRFGGHVVSLEWMERNRYRLADAVDTLNIKERDRAMKPLPPPDDFDGDSEGRTNRDNLLTAAHRR